LVVTICCQSTQAQNWSLISNQKLENSVRIIKTDRFGNFYLNDARGNIIKLDSLGQFQLEFAPAQYGQLTSLESWTTLRIFLFYQDIQQYAFLDRYLNPSEFLRLPEGLFGMVALASPSSDNQLWLLDMSPLNLIKFDINFNIVSLSQPLHQLSDTIKLQPYQLMEYQNRVYLGDSELGILVFDNLGNYLRTIKKSGVDAFYLLNEELYYLKSNQLHFASVYQDDYRLVDLPDTSIPYQHAVLTNSKAILISNQRLFMYAYNP
jgi:hypothetical protein